LILDGAQAGLSWSTILNKRDAYRAAFDNFEPEKIARYTQKKVDKLMSNIAIVRNKRKIASAINNAKAYLKLEESGTTFSDYLWRFVDAKPIVNHWKEFSEIPAVTPLSQQISKDLKKRGFNFVGPTIVYAFLQAAGFVNDHLVSCFRHPEHIH
jgi:DNA-3-methyladenine glycosylase I